MAQTAQQQGTAAKTIIILQPQNVPGATQPKVIVQRLQSPPPSNPAPPPSPNMLTANAVQTQQTVQTQPATIHSQSVSAHTQAAVTVHTQPPTVHPPMKVITPSQLSKPQGTMTLANSAPQTTSQLSQNLKQNLKTVKLSSQTTSSSQTSTSPVSSANMPTILAPCATPVTVASSSPSIIVNSTPNPVVTPSTVISSPVSSANTVTVHAAVKPPEPQGHFLCEWRGCMRLVLYYILTHVTNTLYCWTL